jgi:hypothetical protein
MLATFFVGNRHFPVTNGLDQPTVRRSALSLKGNNMGKGNNSQKNDKKNKKPKKDSKKPATKKS